MMGETTDNRPSRAGRRAGGRTVLRVVMIPALLVVLLGATLAGFGIVADFHHEEQRAVSDFAEQAQTGADVASEVVRGQLDVLGAVAATEAVRSGDIARVSNLFRRVDPHDTGFTNGVFLIGPDGTIDFSSEAPGASGANVADRDYFAAAMSGQRAVGTAVVSRTTGVAVVPMAVPIRDDDDRVVGVVSGSVRLDMDGPVVRTLGWNEPQQQVIGRAGNVIVAQGPIARLAPPPEPVRAALASAPAGTRTGTVDALGRTHRVVAWAPVPNAGWTVIRSEAADSLFGAARRSLWLRLAVLAVMVVIVLMAVAWLAARLQRRYDAAEARVVAARRDEARQERLAAVMGRLATSASRVDVARIVVEEGAAVFGAVAAGISMRDEVQSDEMRVVHRTGWPEIATQGWERFRLSPELPVGVAVLTGVPVFLTEDDIDERYPTAAAPIRAGGGRAWVALPLLDGPYAFGALTLALPGPVAVDPAAREQLRLLAERTASAIVRAARQEVEHEATLAFQESVLPHEPETIEGVSLDAQYRPSHRIFGVGGDWYDTVVLDEHRMMIVVGDVVGHGIQAAAAMGQLRVAARTLARTHAPADVIANLHEVVECEETALGATVLCLLVDTAACTIEYANAGHPPAMVVDRDGHVRTLDGGLGPLLGVADGERHSVVTGLAGVRSLVLYTDGLVERRNEPIDVGFGRLAAAVSAEPEGRLSCERIMKQCLEDEPARDDAVVVCVSLTLREPPQLELFATPPLGARLH